MATMGERIKIIRKELGITQKEFSQNIKVTQSYLSRVESNKEIPTDMLIKLISLEYKVSDLWLKTGKGNVHERDVNKEVSDMSRRQINDSFEQLSSTLNKLDNYELNAYISEILYELCTLTSDHFDSFDTIIFDQLTALIVDMRILIFGLKELDPQSKDYKYNILKMTMNATKHILGYIESISSAFEENTCRHTKN